MPKRAREASAGGDDDRAGGRSSAGRTVRPRRSVADLFPLPELFLRVLSFLEPAELAQVQGVSRYWQHMTLDPQVNTASRILSGKADHQLWKRLYLQRYPHPHRAHVGPLTPARRGSAADATPTGTPTPQRLRPIARLPSRAFPPPSPTPSDTSTAAHTLERGGGTATALSRREWLRHEGVDWKSLYRLGSNWSNGNVLSEATVPLPPSPSATPRPVPHVDSAVPHYSEQHIALFPSFIITSSPISPLAHVYNIGLSATSSPAPIGIIPPPPGWSSPSRPDNVTAICADQAVAVFAADAAQPAPSRRPLPARVAIFYQSGGFAIVRVALDGDNRLVWVREAVLPPSSRPRRRRALASSLTDADPVVLAAMHHPVIVTCTQSFQVSTYALEAPPPPAMGGTDAAARPRHLQTMHSAVSFHPAALSLYPEPSLPGTFRAALTYCTPLYPASWTVAVQELGIAPASPVPVQQREVLSVGSGGPAGAILEWPRKVAPVVGVRGRAVGVGTDGRWCVLAGADNQIHVYALPDAVPYPTPSPSPPPPSRLGAAPEPAVPRIAADPAGRTIAHAQTLLAHSAAVSSVSLNAGRCVSAGRDGRVLVWELDETDDGDDSGGARLGRTVGYVEVRPGGRRPRPARAPPSAEPGGLSGDDSVTDDAGDDDDDSRASSPAWRAGLPHPKSIATAARALFLPRPPDRLPPASPSISATSLARRDASAPAIRQLAFDEEKIVGLVNEGAGEVMKVWSFSG